jgi:hypothetical protein
MVISYCIVTSIDLQVKEWLVLSRPDKQVREGIG